MDTSKIVSSGGKKRKAMYDLPSKEEQLHLRETEDLMRSNVIKLQIDEIIKEVEVNKHSNTTTHTKIEEWLQTFKGILSTIDIKNNSDVDQEWLNSHNLNLPIDSYDGKLVKLKFSPPTLVTIVGSHILHTATKPFLNIDISITMPDDCFNSKDILNFTYFEKRKLYLGAIAYALQKHSEMILPNSIILAQFKSDQRKPILILKPNLKTKYSIRLIPTINSNLFNLTRLEPTKNNIRPKSWLNLLETSAKIRENPKNNSKGHKNGNSNGDDNGDVTDILDPSTLLPTPNYNAAILEDMAILIQNEMLAKVVGYNVYRDTIILLKIWLTQNGMRYQVDTLDGHGAGLIVAYLAQKRQINHKMSLTSSFQTCLKFLAETDFLHMNLNFNAPDTIRPLGDSSYNVFWRMSASSVLELREAAKTSLSYLGRANVTPVLLSKNSFFERFDVFIHVSLSLPVSYISSDNSAASGSFSGDNDISLSSSSEPYSWWSSIAQIAVSTLMTGLADRVCAVRAFGCTIGGTTTTMNNNDNDSEHMIAEGMVDPSETSHYPGYTLIKNTTTTTNNSTTSTSVNKAQRTLVIGFRLDADYKNYDRHVERGPAYDSNDELLKFRSFWGSICQMRRFRDGSIVEAVLWPKELHGSSLVQHIALYLLERHLPTGCLSKVHHIRSSADLEKTLPSPDRFHTVSSSSSSSRDHETYRKAIRTLDKLREIFLSHDTDELPLSIEKLSALSPELRYTSILPPFSHPLVDGSKSALRQYAGDRITKVIGALSVMVTLKRSSAWPTEFNALLHTKTAMLIRIGDVLRDKQQIRSVVHGGKDCSLDVFLEGFVFRLRLAIDSTITEGESNGTTITQRNELTSSSRKQEESWMQLTRHHSAIHSLCSSFPTFGETVRLLALWVSNNYFSGHISHETLELLCASVYLEDTPPPSSPLIGYMRALKRLSEFDWEITPLIVDFSLLWQSESNSNVAMDSSHKPLDASDIDAIQIRFDKNKKNHSAPPMCIISSLDQLSRKDPVDGNKDTVDRAESFPFSAFTKNEPEKVSLSIIRHTARTAVNKLMKWISCDTSNNEDDEHNDQWKSYIKGPSCLNSKMYSNISEEMLSGRQMVCSDGHFHPHPIQAEFIHKLRSHFGHYALFFWNHLKADTIGIVWRPVVFLPVKFSIRDSQDKIFCAHGSGTGSGSGMADNVGILDVSTIVVKMLSLSDGLVDKFIYR
eukprot:gene7991-16353_t